jgi:hypothetical protein
MYKQMYAAGKEITWDMIQLRCSVDWCMVLLPRKLHANGEGKTLVAAFTYLNALIGTVCNLVNRMTT